MTFNELSNGQLITIIALSVIWVSIFLYFLVIFIHNKLSLLNSLNIYVPNIDEDNEEDELPEVYHIMVNSLRPKLIKDINKYYFKIQVFNPNDKDEEPLELLIIQGKHLAFDDIAKELDDHNYITVSAQYELTEYGILGNLAKKATSPFFST